MRGIVSWKTKRKNRLLGFPSSVVDTSDFLTCHRVGRNNLTSVRISVSLVMVSNGSSDYIHS